MESAPSFSNAVTGSVNFPPPIREIERQVTFYEIKDRLRSKKGKAELAGMVGSVGVWNNLLQLKVFSIQESSIGALLHTD